MAIQTSVLSVEGMSCSHCEARIKKVVGALNGVSKVTVDLNGKKVSVDYAPEKVTINLIKATIEDQGYEVLL